ncbi:hypothetical protein CBOM_01613 [Ceraceosorus bombacis]|uniref:Uncharacterized protein n=1 Tax=Ceraceosorus bombacis TaxID=401625 RepID=A0A0P1A397_9BASI|nr:hypothetical protein CBOM_01613 [Ceraceosorus bombacis]
MGEGQPRKRLRFADDNDVAPALRHFRRYSDNPVIPETSLKSPPESSGPAGVALTSPSPKSSEASVGVTHPHSTASLSYEEHSIAATNRSVGEQTIPAEKSKQVPSSSSAGNLAEPRALASPRLAPPESGGTRPIRRESMTSNQHATPKADGGKTTIGVKLAPTPSLASASV